MKMTTLDRLLLLATCLLSAWQIAIGIDQFGTLPIIAYTIGFGVLLVAGLLLIILGFEALDSPIVVILSTAIPLSLSLGLAWEYLTGLRTLYLAFAILGFLAIVLTRLIRIKTRLPVFVLTFVHGISGMTIFLLPISLAFGGQVVPMFTLVGVGGALIGVGGLLLSFQKIGRPILPQRTILKILPGLLFLTTLAFVLGFSAV
jgi:hypothetical protein